MSQPALSQHLRVLRANRAAIARLTPVAMKQTLSAAAAWPVFSAVAVERGFLRASGGVLLAEVVDVWSVVSATRSRREKVARLAECLARMDADEVAIGAVYLAGSVRQERLGVGWRTVVDVAVGPAAAPTLRLRDVDVVLDDIAAVAGPGSQSTRRKALEGVFGAATADEQRFLQGLILGELRQGALAGVAAQAIAAAWQVPEADVRRALMLHADIGAVARAARAGGGDALRAFRLTLFRPLSPMLAQTSATVGDALAGLVAAAIDDKIDGARVQVHRLGDEVRVYTRSLRDVTARSTEVVAVAAALDVGSIVLDGEVVALRDDGRPHPFQDTMSRFGTDLQRAGRQPALTPFFFDCLHLDGSDLLDAPTSQRIAALERVVPAEHLVARRIVNEVDAAEAVLADALGRGHEGVMVKALDAPYEAGRRGAAWRKVKPAHTLDLVVLAVEWGSGRRHSWLSNLHLGARNADGGFVMLGKTFKGMTDTMLTWQTQRLLELETHRDGHIVHVRPELVVEVAFDGVQTSSRYPGGVALRFARVKRYREDKSADEVDTIDLVRALQASPPPD